MNRLFLILFAVILITVSYKIAAKFTLGTQPIAENGRQPSITPQYKTPSYIAPSIKSQPTPQQDETANWKVYHSEKYRFEVKYPADFPIETGQNGPNNSIFGLYLNYVRPTTDGGGPSKYLWISIEPKRTATTCANMNGKSSGTISISGINATKCIIEGSYFGEGQGLYIEVQHGSYIYGFIADYYDKNKTTLDKIISTFKFTQ